MHALEAKTCENRRFWGRFSEELSSVETCHRILDGILAAEFSEELSSVETLAYAPEHEGNEQVFRRT